MDVTLRGNSPSTVTAGIMLLTRARQLGYPLRVAIIGEEGTLTPVRGPAVLYAPVLASCGVGRDHGAGATVVLPGPPTAPLLVTVAPHGVEDWFLVDRSGQGTHPATQAFVRLSADPRTPARALARALRQGIEALGMTPDPAVLDVLFAAPVPPLLRMALALRAGRAMSGGRGDSVTRYLSSGTGAAYDPIPAGAPDHAVVQAILDGRLAWIYDRLATGIRDRVEGWVQDALQLSRDDGGRDLALLAALAELASHLAQLPVHSILPPLGAAEDSVATALGAALRAEGDADANQQLCQVYRFLGGRFVDSDPHPIDVSDTPAPDPDADTVACWRWFCAEVRIGRKRADAIFEQLFHPAQ